MQKIALFITLFVNQTIFCQKDSLRPSLKEIDKANGKINLETYYPVDTSTYSSKIIYLDSNFQRINHHVLAQKYIISENVVFSFYGINRICNRKPYSVKLDSTVMFKEYEFSIPCERIISGSITYKSLFWLAVVRIENGYAISCKKTNRKGTKIKVDADYSGLYAKENKTWPTFIMYHKNGKIKEIHREIYYNKNVLYLIWKPK